MKKNVKDKRNKVKTKGISIFRTTSVQIGQHTKKEPEITCIFKLIAFIIEINFINCLRGETMKKTHSKRKRIQGSLTINFEVCGQNTFFICKDSMQTIIQRLDSYPIPPTTSISVLQSSQSGN